MEVQTNNSPDTPENKQFKPADRWTLSVGDGDKDVPSNAPVEVLGTASRRIAFGEIVSADEPIAASVEGETRRWRGGRYNER